MLAVKELKNKLIRVLIMAPLAPVGFCGISYMLLGYVPDSSLRSAIVLAAFCALIAALLVWTTRRAVLNRVYLHVKPNAIEVESAEKFSGDFSSSTHFIASAEAFQKTLQSVAGRKSYTQGRFMSPRESAYVRIWPGDFGVSELELDAIGQALAKEFIEVEIEVMDDAQSQGNQDTAIKA